MSFQEFASKLFGGRDELENKAKEVRVLKKKEKQSSGPFSGNINATKKELRSRKQLNKAKEIYEETKENEIIGTTEEWMAEKKLRRGETEKRQIGNDIVIEGELKRETEDALLLEGEHFSKTTNEQWIPKSQFEEFESQGPELSSSQTEKAEEIMEKRSKKARRTDKRNAAPIAGSFEEWKKDPSETDIPEIDTIGSGNSLDDLL